MLPFFENRNDSFSASVAENLTFPLHQHGHLELFYLLDGCAEVTVRRQAKRLEKGALAVIFPNQVHSYRSEPSGSRAALLISDPTLAGVYGGILLSQHPSDPFLPPELLHPNVEYALQEILKESAEGGNDGVCGPLLQLILARVLPGLPLHQNLSSDSLDLTYQIVHYISNHFRDPLSLDSLSRSLGVSKYYLSHVFSEKMGMSFPEYLQSIRLNCAVSLIAGGEQSITEIAADSGFESQRTFYRAFRARFGITPLQYRKRLLQPGRQAPEEIHAI